MIFAQIVFKLDSIRVQKVDNLLIFIISAQ